LRWQTAIVAGALALTACETNDAADPIEVSSADLSGTYDLVSVGGELAGQLDPEFCLVSTLTMAAAGDWELQHLFIERVAVGQAQACRTDAERTEVLVVWNGTFENTSTLVVMTVEESTIIVTTSESTAEFVTQENTELVGEFNPQTDRLVMRFPDIWSFDPHGGSGGKISLGGDARGLGGGTLVFEK
jgi:hypothetical protein